MTLREGILREEFHIDPQTEGLKKDLVNNTLKQGIVYDIVDTMRLLSVNIVLSTAKRLKKEGWKFDWDKSFGAISQKIAYLENDKIQGLVEFEEVPSSLYNIIYRIELSPDNIGKNKKIDNIAGTLFAYVAKDSLDAGFEGFVVFDSKTILIDHYVEKYGAQVLFGNRLYFDTKASKALVNKYLKGENNG